MSSQQVKSPSLISADFGLKQYGVTLKVDDPSIVLDTSDKWVIDIETDEKDNFVGIGLSSSIHTVYYFTSLYKTLCKWLEQQNLIGHNLKFDAKLLRKWGLDIKSDRLFMDTMLMSYVDSPTKESHGLKELAREMDIHYPTYKEIVGKGKKKVTLDKQSVEIVSNYCAMDVYATTNLYHQFNTFLNSKQKYYLDKLEMPIMRLLFDMETIGIMVNPDYLTRLKDELEQETALLNTDLYDDGLENSRSPKQVKEWLKSKGIEVASTDKKYLNEVNHPSIDLLQKYREKFKLLSTYVKPLLELAPRVHTTFNQVTYDKNQDQWNGIRTGRLSSSYPNLHNIPIRTKAGKLLRKAFIANFGQSIICADYSQIEYRLLAHFTEEPDLIKAFKEGKDIHEETGRLLETDRKLGKTLNFASIYGAGPQKISQTAGISIEDASQFLDAYWSKLKRVRSWIDRVKQSARRKKGIETILGRFIPIPNLDSKSLIERFHAERAAVNYVIQGSAAEIIKLAMLKCNENLLFPVLQIHDELLFEDLDIDAPVTARNIKEVMESIITLKVPLIVDIGIGRNWAEAKGD